MTETTENRRWVTVLRWAARLWSLALLGFFVLVIFIPDPSLVGPVPVSEQVELGLYGVALLGLLLAWRWEALGALIALAGVLGQDIAFRLFRGYWFHSMGASLVLMLAFIVPAVLFLLCWYLSREPAEMDDLTAQTPLPGGEERP